MSSELQLSENNGAGMTLAMMQMLVVAQVIDEFVHLNLLFYVPLN